MIKEEKKSTFATFHPIVTFVYFAAVIGITMFSMNPIFLAMTFIISFIYSVMIYGSNAIKLNLSILVPIMIVTMVLNPLFTHKGKTVLFYLNGNAMTLESIIYGLAAATMLSSMIIWFSCFNKMMSSDKFIYLFGRVAPAISLILSMCFRFIPMLKNRFKEISEGQKCMGRDFSGGSLIKRSRQLCKEISILIAWSLEVSIETSDSMEARGYGLKGRTSFSIFRFDKRDGRLMSLIIILFTIVLAGCMKGQNNILYYPEVIFTTITPFSIIVIISYFLLLLVPIIIDIRGELMWKRLSLEI
ncbi:MAG: energy-coupling factor transporter transmembrane protein EcfT [Clostridium sp.]|uniref:energy-coupling factor transporter transmembrane component T n=1 Tax=Clostridium sp. TaxID=1506 RepID=UPI002A86F800|nr:energy-coupling factor transporter transmembrane protein EcfT [Clostridium sp.]MDY5096877.1 energy-coupling factor transporter transmembrane component T [Clostridium sp.]